GVRSRPTSSTTPFLPRSSRRPNQSPVRRGRDQKSPPQVGGTSYGCALAGRIESSRSSPRTSSAAQRAPPIPSPLIARPSKVPNGSRPSSGAPQFRSRREDSIGPWSQIALQDAGEIGRHGHAAHQLARLAEVDPAQRRAVGEPERHQIRSEEHTSELQSLTNLVCRLLLEKKNKTKV